MSRLCWNGASWEVPYASNGCPRLMEAVQVMYSNMSTGGANEMPFIGMLVLRNP